MDIGRRYQISHWAWFLPFPRAQGNEDKQHFSLLQDGLIRTYSAENFPELAAELVQEIRIHMPLGPPGTFQFLQGYGGVQVAESNPPGRSVIAVDIFHINGQAFSRITFFYDLGRFAAPSTNGTSETTATLKELTPLALPFSKRCKTFIGFSQPSAAAKVKVVFIDRSCWVSSIDLSSLLDFGGPQKTVYTQHFFVPNNYLQDYFEAGPAKTGDGEGVVFSLDGELVCIRNGMAFEKMKEL